MAETDNPPSLEQRVNTIEQKTEALERQNQTWAQISSERQDRLARIEQRQDTAEQKQTALTDDVTSLKADVSTLKTDVASVKADVSTVKSETSTQTATLQRIETAISTYAPKVEKVFVEGQKFFNRPIVKYTCHVVALTIGLACAMWLNRHGIKVNWEIPKD